MKDPLLEDVAWEAELMHRPTAGADFQLLDGSTGYTYHGIAGWNVYVEGQCVLGDTASETVWRWLNARKARLWKVP